VVTAAASKPARTRGVASFPPVISQNPYQRLLYAHLAPFGVHLIEGAKLKAGWLWGNRSLVDVLHFHWPQSYYQWLWEPSWARLPLSWLRLVVFTARLGFARLLGYRLIWTVHQVYPHETVSRRIDRLAGRVLAAACHALAVHDRSTAALIKRDLGVGAANLLVVPHGSYLGVYPEGRDRATVRGELGLPPDAFVFLAFGHVREYKDLELLLAAFKRMNDPRAVLLVAGPALDTATVKSLRNAAATDPRVQLLLEFVPDERVAEVFGAADAAVLARGDGGTSGALVLALSLGLPAVAADVPAYAELLAEGQAGWLFAPGVEESLHGALAQAASDHNEVARKGVAARAQAEALRWEDHCERLAEVMLGDTAEAKLSYA
jgi:beta-1,4-mannosyltransferase